MNTESIIFIAYLAVMLAVGVYFFIVSKGGEKEYFLGGRKMGPWVSALSAGASDMSAWSLMGLPASVFAFGMGRSWIAVGLLAGYVLAWIIEAPRLRRFTIAAEDSITIPEYLTKRFKSDSPALRLICALLFLTAYTVYAAASIKACGTLFNTVTGINEKSAMYTAAFIIISYTFMGGYKAVCWTDFFQGLLMLAALLIAPIFAAAVIKGGGGMMDAAAIGEEIPGYWNFLSADPRDIISGLGWGLGYFGMPHIIVRFMSAESDKAIKKARVIAVSWTAVILFFGCAVGAAGRMLLGDINDSSTIFIQLVRHIFPPVICGVFLSAILAAAMSSADSQLLAASSAFSSDIYKACLRKNAGEKEMLWAGRTLVALISLIAVFIAGNPSSGSVMSLVENAWGLFGAAFGPAILLSLFWRRFNIYGAGFAIVAGGAADILWLLLFRSTGIYEIVPASAVTFVFGIAAALMTPEPGSEVAEIFDRAAACGDQSFCGGQTASRFRGRV